MLKKNQSQNRNQINMVCIEDLVPKNHILRGIDAAIDFSFIYDEVESLYSENTGRPSVDPVVLFKIVLVQYLFGIRSMRQTIKEIEVNMAYRWFCGFDMLDTIPNFTTFGKNYSRRFVDSNIFEIIFEKILQEAITAGFVDAKAAFIDSTHVKASANNKKSTNKTVKVEVKNYQKELNEEIASDRAAHGKKPLKDDNDDEPPTKNIKQSTTDPESGLFHKGEHKVVFAYTLHTACDLNNFVLGVNISPGNVHDSVMFDGLYKDLIAKFPEIKMVGVDSGYKIPWIMKQIFDSGRLPATPYKRPMTKKGFFRKYEYVYDEYYDCIICPNDQILKYSTTNRDGYKEYKSNPKICESCGYLSQCTMSKARQKTVTRHVWDEYMERAEDVRNSPNGKAVYKLRCETIERVFADAKEKHGMRYGHFRGIAKMRMQALLTFACMNLKKLAKWKEKNGGFTPVLTKASIIFEYLKTRCKKRTRYWEFTSP
ncbi:MAG: IS1182 family transposase, partial [Christensenellaceae bacterium]